MAGPRLIIGLVGRFSSGKDTVAAHLVERYAFVHVSTGDLIRFYIAEHQLGEPTRELQQQVGNFLRAEHGADYLARLALEDPAERTAVSGLRNPTEVALLKKEGGIIIAVDAPLELRYARAKERGRLEDNATFEEFKRLEEIEKASSNPNGQIVSEVLAMADHILINDGDLKALQTKTDELLKQLNLS